MKLLRQRIFTSVKPKTLYNKIITGETLIELCESYTNAINSGTVPCIESAWTYLCKNESQRAHQESLDLYSSAM
jgi:hypothetical protein